MPINGHKKESQSPLSLSHSTSAAIAATFEVGFFHPLDTVQKRLMKNTAPIYDTSLPFSKNAFNAINVSFKDPSSQRISLYPGILPAISYKPLLEGALREHLFPASATFWPAAISGAMMGAGEVIFLPLDIYKIRKQTGSHDQGISYRGIGTTMIRNTGGSFALFGVPAWIQTTYFQESKATHAQRIGTQFLGAVTSLVVSSPLDVVKTRMQADLNSKGAWSIAMDIAKKNPSQFFKAIGPKIAGQGTKLTAFMAIKDLVMDALDPEHASSHKP